MLDKEEVVREARKRYRKAISLDCLDDAVTMVLMDSCMWDSPTGSPFDTTYVIEQDPKA